MNSLLSQLFHICLLTAHNVALERKLICATITHILREELCACTLHNFIQSVQTAPILGLRYLQSTDSCVVQFQNVSCYTGIFFTETKQ